MSVRAFAGIAAEPAFTEPKTAPRPSHLLAPAAGDKRTRDLLAALRPRPVLNVGDLLEAVPFRHDDFREHGLLANLPIGEEATLLVTVEGVRVRPTRRRNLVIVEARVRDESGPGVLVWFNQRYLAKQLQPGMRLSVRGERRGTVGAEIAVRRHELLGADESLTHTSGLVPVYHSSEKLTSRRIGDLVTAQLGHVGDAPDSLPSGLRTRRGLPLRRDALLAAHRPDTLDQARTAEQRLAFEELFLLQAGLISHRRALERTTIARALGRPGEMIDRFRASLPFTPTAAQDRAMAEIDGDLDRSVPMQRLLQGDVGSGKTLVAVHALLRAVERDGQGAMMAPTETLATQHLLGVSALCEPLGVRVTPLVQGMPARERRAALGVIESGEPQLVVGTHALIQDAVVFGRLERGGGGRAAPVRRGAARARSRPRRATRPRPHVLHMTATPIPRTLALTVYGDLDVSVLDELPPGRKPVVTRLVPRARRDEVFARMRRLLDEGRQAYVVCPLVTESPAAQATAAESEAERLQRGDLRGYSVGVDARPDAHRGAAVGDGAVPDGRAVGAGRDHRDRGGRGRAQRRDHGDRGGRPVRAGAAAPAARAGRPRRPRELLHPPGRPAERRLGDPAAGDGAHQRRLRAGRGRSRAARRGQPAGARARAASPTCGTPACRGTGGWPSRRGARRRRSWTRIPAWSRRRRS